MSAEEKTDILVAAFLGETEPQKEVVEEKSEETIDTTQDTPPDDDISSLKKKIEITEKRMVDNQKYATKANQAIKNIKKNLEEKLAELLNDGAIDEEYQKTVLSGFDIDHSVFPEDKAPQILSPYEELISPLTNAFSKETMETYEKYFDDPNWKDKAAIFSAYFEDLPDDKKKDMVRDLCSGKDSLQIVKNVLKVGHEQRESIYGMILQHGGVKNYIEQASEKMKKIQSENEKLKKKLSQYEDFDDRTSPNFSESQHLSSGSPHKKSPFDDLVKSFM